MSNSKYWNSDRSNTPLPVSPKVNFGEMDHRVIEFWDAHRIFLRSIEERGARGNFVAYDGPPGTNGVPHIGHMMQSALKDLWPRYKTMQGYRVLRKAGWDTHGLPVELTAEKELGLESKRDILTYGVENYIEYCRKTVFRYKDEWTKAIRRIGRFLDTENDYATLTNDYIQTDWWVLKQAWDKGLLYQDQKIMPYCPRCGTSLSAHETAQGYQDIQDISLYVKFKVVGQENTYFVAWTTTAWTLLSNVALAVAPDVVYATVKTNGEKLIIAETRLEAMKGMLGDYKVVERRQGSKLGELKYKALWDFLDEHSDTGHYVIVDNYVTTEDGSGIVHIAHYGEDDFRLIRTHKLPVILNVDENGKCKPATGQFAGRYFREEGLDVDILKDLASRGLILGKEKITHSYPHCYRCDSPLMYFAKTSWFLNTTAFKDQLLEANSRINWYPDHIKNGRFGNWLENNVPWAISRERYWGSPLPIWTCEKCGHRICVESLADLESRLKSALPGNFDPHKPQIDRVELPCDKCGGVMRREPEVLDSWFNAGIMPWGQWGYPAAPGSKEQFDSQYPGDFICEAIDQTRGWFYTMLAISTMLTGKSSFKNVICTELISDKQGKKMSKSRGNVVDPLELCERFGADAVRWYFYSSNPWNARRFDDADITEGLKQVIIPYWNAYSFFVTYALVDNWRPDASQPRSDRTLDRWILSRLEFARERVETAMDGYDVMVAAGAITEFIDELTNWFIRRSRRRFWKSVDDRDKYLAYATLYEVLSDLNLVIAPLMPFLSETIHQNLIRSYNGQARDSVHLEDWPPAKPQRRDSALEERMGQVREAVRLALSLRNEGGVRVRQPLAELVVVGLHNDVGQELEDIICDELNVKKLTRLADTGELVTPRAKANFKLLGSRLGAAMKPVAAAVETLDANALREYNAKGFIEIQGHKLTGDDLIITEQPREGYWVRSEGDLTVALDYRTTDELTAEWLARELVHHVQNLRKEADLEVSQRITLEVSASAKLSEAAQKYGQYIRNETLAVELKTVADLQDGSEIKVGDETGRIALRVAQPGG